VKSLALAEGRLSLRGVLTTLEVRTVDLDPARLANVNTPDDLARIEPRPA
jgi:molybdopterin-guanine dinucleotide biosynthesis protein A